jgi:hypothetical protein
MIDQQRPNDQPAQDLVTGEAGSAPRPPASEPAVRQLDAILENLANYAAPVAAGPMAQGLADKTEAAGGRLSTKGRELASDLRRETAVAKSGTGNPPLEPVEQTTAEEEAGLPPR